MRGSSLTVMWLDEVNKVGHFEPVGTHRHFQGQGLARALMLHGLREMQRLGMDLPTVEYEASNLPAHNLYRSLGFEGRYETFGFRPPAPRPSPPRVILLEL